MRIGILSGIDINETKRIRERALRNETGFRIEEIENELANEVEIYIGIDTNEIIEEPMDTDIGVDPGKVGGYFPPHLNILGGDPPPVMEC